MKNDLGWTFPVFKKERVSIADIELNVGLDHWRPRYSWACDDIHASFTPSRVGLGVAEAQSDFLLAGRSDAGFTDPAQMMAISLNIATSSLPNGGFTEADIHVLHCLDALAHDIKHTFWETQQRTAGPSGSHAVRA